MLTSANLNSEKFEVEPNEPQSLIYMCAKNLTEAKKWLDLLDVPEDDGPVEINVRIQHSLRSGKWPEPRPAKLTPTAPDDPLSTTPATDSLKPPQVDCDTADIYLPCSRQGDDLAHHLKTNDPATALLLHANEANDTGERLKSIAAIIGRAPVTFQAEKHNIAVQASPSVIRQLVDEGLAYNPRKRQEAD